MRRHPTSFLAYRRCRFVTQLPLVYVYTRSHYWMRRGQGQKWRIGLTKFGTRLLGEMVEYGFSVEVATEIVPGQVIGWLEGFKALSDLVSPLRGTFAGSNPELKENITLLNRDPYGAGWIYAALGRPAADGMSARAYAAHLNQTIDRLRKASGPK